MHELKAIISAVTICRLNDIQPAASRVAQVAREIGLQVGATTDISSRDDLFDHEGVSLHLGPFGWDDPKKRWWDRPQLALKSPVAQACRYESEAFWCNRDGAHGCVQNPELDRISFRQFFDTVPHLNALIVVPVRLTFGRIGAAAFSPLDDSITDLSRTYTHSANLLSAMMRRFLATYAVHGNQCLPIKSDMRLGRREVQCLYWASQGKTDAETAIILGVSHAAIRYHVTRAVEKLDCVNRAQAIFKAGQLGFLSSS